MARSFVQRQMEMAAKANEKKTAAQAESVSAFDDTDVCMLLGLRRRILVQARTRQTRGEDWLVVGAHAGMTAKWIKGRNPNADIGRLSPIAENDKIVTVVAVQRVVNNQKIVCRRIADDQTSVVSVRDAAMIHLGDQFDCLNEGGRLIFKAELNREAY